jgi:hypothetical protein
MIENTMNAALKRWQLQPMNIARMGFGQRLQPGLMRQIFFHPMPSNIVLPIKTKTLCAVLMPAAMLWLKANVWCNGGQIIWTDRETAKHGQQIMCLCARCDTVWHSPHALTCKQHPTSLGRAKQLSYCGHHENGSLRRI